MSIHTVVLLYYYSYTNNLNFDRTGSKNHPSKIGGGGGKNKIQLYNNNNNNK